MVVSGFVKAKVLMRFCSFLERLVAAGGAEPELYTKLSNVGSAGC